MAANRVLALVISIATVAFAVGVVIERSQESSEAEAGTEAAHFENVGSEGEPAESHAEGEASESSPTQEATETHSDESGETLLGINPESIPLLIVAVLTSVLLAGAVWFRSDSTSLLLAVAITMAAFAALDVREFFHQLDASRDGLALLVAVIALLHATASLLAVRIARDGTPQTP